MIVYILVALISFLLGCWWSNCNFQNGKWEQFSSTGWKGPVNSFIAIMIGWYDTDSWLNPYRKVKSIIKLRLQIIRNFMISRRDKGAYGLHPAYYVLNSKI